MLDNTTDLEYPWLPWLADAPLFLDGPQTGVFYDAVLRPAYRTVEMEVAHDRTEELKKTFGANLGVKLPLWFPWLGGSAESKALSKRPPVRRLAER